MYDNLKSVFTEKAIETGAINCIYFDWSLNPKETCSFCEDKYKPCKKFNGGNCKRAIDCN